MTRGGLVRWATAAAALCLTPVIACAELVGIDWSVDHEVLDGASFGDTGSYRLRRGVAYFSFDPELDANTAIVDLDKAPRADDGRVAASADIVVLSPANADRNPRIGLLEVSNRGGKASLRYFNRAARFSDLPEAAADFGDGLLMRRGVTLIWVGWQFDVPREAGRLRLHAPVAVDADGSALEGLARSDWVPAENTQTLPLAHRNHVPYAVHDPTDLRNVLTVRDRREGPRRIIERARWRFAHADGGRVADSGAHIYLAEGFEPGRIYELTYVVQNPTVVGLGLAVVRDTMAYARDAGSEFAVDTALAFGVSQTGRFLRHFLYQGFNADERGRRVFDGMLIHTAGGGRGSFNHRFAQPSRDGHQNSAFFYPTDLFPFAGRTVGDGDVENGLFAVYDDEALLPKIFYTNTGYEYWGRAASLIHTTPDGQHDLAPLANERIFHLASAQHFEGRWPPAADTGIAGAAAWRGNPLPLLVHLRALLVRLIEWTHDDTAPPASRIPTVTEDTLVAVDQLDFPAIPGIATPKVTQRAYRADYGESFADGIVTRQPPALGAPFVSLVPQVDRLGNELGGLASPLVTVPLATYTPWSLYRGDRERLADFRGMIIPLPATPMPLDARPAIATLYPDRSAYLRRLTNAARAQIEQGLLLDEDLARVVAHGDALWDWVAENAGASPAQATKAK